MWGFPYQSALPTETSAQPFPLDGEIPRLGTTFFLGLACCKYPINIFEIMVAFIKEVGVFAFFPHLNSTVI